jgi:hypothetical protein
MNAAQLGKPAPWLRVSLVRTFGRNEIEVRPVAIAYVGAAVQPVLADPGFAELFTLRLQPGDLQRSDSRFLIQIRADVATRNIVDTSDPALVLDAEFAGTQLTPVLLDQIWNLAAPQMFAQVVWDSFKPSTSFLPQSGNNSEGGVLHNWWEVERQ